MKNEQLELIEQLRDLLLQKDIEPDESKLINEIDDKILLNKYEWFQNGKWNKDIILRTPAQAKEIFTKYEYRTLKDKESYQLKIVNFKTHSEAKEWLFDKTGDYDYKHERIRGYEIVENAAMDGYLINIKENCPISNFKSGFKNIKEVKKWWLDNLNDNNETIWNENFDWIDDLFKKDKK